MATYFPWGVGLGLTRVSNRARLDKSKKSSRGEHFSVHHHLIRQSRITNIGICLVVGGAIALSGNPAVAQITPDATLGTESSVVTPNVNIRGLPADQINGGAIRGANLFHSFQEFNVGDGQRVYFANPTGIETILSRITGNNLSNILGMLGVDGGASLFLLNPNGIIFGPNAQLDISGSFFASTADSVVFDNGYQFSAKNPAAPPLLTISVPLGVQYGTNQPRTTISNGGTLAVGQNLTLNAGNLDLQGLVQAGNNLTLQAEETVKIRDSVTLPFIAAAGNQLLVQSNGIVDIFALNHANSGFFSGGDMVLKSPNSVMGDAHYTTGGNFRIEQLDGSLGDLDSPGDPVIRANGNVSFTDYTGASLHIFAGGSVNITGRVTITGSDATNFINETVTLSQILPDGTNTVTVNGSTRPTLDIRAGTTAVGTPVNVCVGCPLGQPTNLTFPNTPLTADITINQILINRPDGLVFLTNQYQPNPALTGNIQVTGIFADDGNGGFSGKASDVVIDSRGNITLLEEGRIRTDSATGNGGNVTLIANGSFTMRPGSQFFTSISGQGKAGDITIKVGDAVSLIGDTTPGATPTLMVAKIDSGGVGNGGEITIEADSLSIDYAQIQSVVWKGGGFFGIIPPGQGNAGNVNINVRGAVNITGSFSGIFTALDVGATGNSGNINIQAGTLTLTDGGVLNAGVFSQGQGKAGTITLDVRDITIAGVNAASGIPSQVTVDASTGASGQAGTITTINTNKLTVADGANLNASSYSSADGGDITVNANTVELIGGGQILALPYAQGNAGNVTLNVSDRLTISGNDPTFESRFLEFGPDVVTNQGGASGVFTGYGLGPFAALLNIPIESTGNAGNISIKGPREVNIDGGQLFTAGFNSGNGGNLSITETDSVNLNNTGLIVTSTFGTGNAGTLLVDTGKLNLQNQSLIVSSTAGAGDAGKLTINATDSVEVLSGSRIASETVGTGNGANLTIDTRRLVTRNGEISVGTTPESSGRSGNLRVVATDSVDISGEAGTPVGGLFSSTLGSGQGGNLTVETARLNIRDGGRIEAGTGGIAPGGTVTVNASDSIELSGTSVGGILPSGISSFSLQLGNADGGDVNVTTGNLTIQDGAEITTRSDGLGNAGDINVNVSANFLSTRGNITATSTQLGGGDITLAADDIRLFNSSLISTSVKESTGGGGNITIDSTVFLAVEDSDILANAEAGPGGNIKINSDAFLAAIFARGLAIPVGRNPGDFARFRGNGRVDISVDSRTGTSGTLEIPNVGPAGRAASLPANLVDGASLIDRRCTPASTAKDSSFTVTGRGGLPPSPNDPLMYYEDTTHWVILEPGKENRTNPSPNTTPSSSKPQPLVEAQGWIINEKGEVCDSFLA